MVLIDTSVWIFALRKNPNKAVKDKVDNFLKNGQVAISPPIKLELLGGLTHANELERMAQRLNAMPNLQIKDSTWSTGISLAFNLRRKGFTVPYFDLLISSVAIENNTTLVHADFHFDIISKHTGLKVDSCLRLIQDK